LDDSRKNRVAGIDRIRNGKSRKRSPRWAILPALPSIIQMFSIT
jgi:hypothetical protein